MKIWDIVKNDFDGKKNANSKIDEGWKEMGLGAAMALSTLGSKASEKPLKAAPEKIEYSASVSDVDPATIGKFKKQYTSLIASKSPMFKRKDRNYDGVIQYIANLDIKTSGDKIYVIDDSGKKTEIKGGGSVDQKIYKIFGDYIINYLEKNNEDKVAEYLFQDIKTAFANFLGK